MSYFSHIVSGLLLTFKIYILFLDFRFRSSDRRIPRTHSHEENKRAAVFYRRHESEDSFAEILQRDVFD